MGKKIGVCVFCDKEKQIAARGLCDACYGRYLKRGSPEYIKVRKPCSIESCGNLSVAQNLCNMHYQRKQKHGTTKQTRPKGWGSKEKHPLYHTWQWQKRNAPKIVFAAEWLDFWQFVKDVGERPSPDHRFCVIDSSKPIYKDNYEWQKWEKGGAGNRTEYAREWRKKNPDKVKDFDLRRRFGITLDEYRNLLEKQGSLCVICSQPELAHHQNGQVRELAVDHDHKTGKVRGLLCTGCNAGLGNFQDSPTTLQKALNYLDKHAVKR